MKEKLVVYKDRLIEYWNGRTKLQRGMIFGSFLLLVIALIFVTSFASKSTFVPLYTNLSVQETGEIKATLDARGIASEISDNGTTISVPEQQVDILKVELAAEGLPKSGSIDYSVFKDKMGFGMTDNEFSVIERAAIQTELANLIRNIEGVNSANVMITLPEESLWISEQGQVSSASIVLNLATGYQLNQQQVNALYHLVSKSVPKLPMDNIVIMNQMFEHFELKNDENSILDSTLTVYDQQRQIKNNIERDLQRQVQQMLGTIMGHDKVLVSVTTDIDFTKENREESLVTPVDEENMEGLAVSIERITETYTGEDMPEGGVAGAGETDIPNYIGMTGAGGGDYERIEERINNDVNRIRREIVESPYQIRDIGIQVMVEPPDPENLNSLPVERVNDIQQILSTIVRTSISKDIVDQLTPEQINDKVFVSAQPFNGKVEIEQAASNEIPMWLYVVGGVLVVVILLLLFLLFKKNKNRQKDMEFEEFVEQPAFDIPDINEERDSDEIARRKQLEKMAKEKPEEFSKLLRSWLSED
ncbi:flagellar basal-body MS-ring/collar protein FliF [Anaerobacillus sp. MEB173]|uniref:flagellar basal-body MS-ring/collar protein FliF n=1 Tax=Anaerobacillus sp. MEB173 TaxID=3383345 RepID=UPI003F8F28F3